MARGLYSGLVMVNTVGADPDLAVPPGGPAVDPIVARTSRIGTAKEIATLFQHLRTEEARVVEIVLELITEKEGQ